MKIVEKTSIQPHKVQEICSVLNISRSTYYYKPHPRLYEEGLVAAVKKSFEDSDKTYGTPRLKVDLEDQGYCVSRRRISRIMFEEKLVSCYNERLKPKPLPLENNEFYPNLLERKFDNRGRYEVLASDTTYVSIGNKWYYLCSIVDLSRREIVSSSISSRRDAQMTAEALYEVDFDLREVAIFHSDWGSEFKNNKIDSILKGFNISRSLSAKGCPHDNAVLESLMKTIKVEFVNRYKFSTIEDFKQGWERFVYRYNHKRLHSSLGYRPPIDPHQETERRTIWHKEFMW